MIKLKCVAPAHGITVGKLYDAVVSHQYDFVDDNSMPRYHAKEALVGCFEVIGDKEEPIKREGVVALLPEDSEFKIEQEVFVDSFFYKGVATIKGYNYNGNPDGYILETPEDVGATPYHNGLCKEGHALWASEDDVKAIPVKTKKWGEWIQHTTGEQPEGLDEDVKIKLKWNDGDITKSTVGSANWYFSENVNITHYKVLLKDKSSKWTKNKGVMPVDGNVKVEVKWRDGTKGKLEAEDFMWSLDDDFCDIVKWRLAE